MPNQTQVDAENYVWQRAEKRHITVQDKRRSGVGYDFEFYYEDRMEKIEVKGNSKDKGIPDMRTNEFDKDRRLKADFIYLIAHASQPEKKVYVIPREEIRPEDLRLLSTYRIRGFGKKRLSKFVSSF